MPKRVAPLTDVKVKNAKAKDGKPTKLADGDGLFLLVDENGNKGWRLKFRLYGKERLMSLGKYPDISLARARELRAEARSLVAAGVDPVLERQAEARAAQETHDRTFKKVALEWHDNQTTLAPKTRYLHQQRFKLDIFPAIGNLPIADITSQIILNKVLRPMEARGVGDLTLRVKSIISQVFAYAISCGYLDRNPTVDLKGALKQFERGNRAAITDDPDQLAQLLRAIYGYYGHAVVQAALKLAPMIFARPGELRAMKWADLDLDAAEWRFKASKTKNDMIVPLPTQAVEILKDLQPVSGRSEYVFPSIRSNAKPISDNTLNAAFRRMGFEKDHVSAHGFRATARTMLDEVLQQRVEFIEMQLGHVVKDSNGTAYNRTMFLKERRRMLQTWANYLDGLREDHGKVIPLRRTKGESRG